MMPVDDAGTARLIEPGVSNCGAWGSGAVRDRGRFQHTGSEARAIEAFARVQIRANVIA